jgi:hypothetical protein
MKLKLIAALIALTVSSPVFAYKVIEYEAIGYVDCGQWLSRNDKDLSSISTGSWLAGFMTGLNASDAKDGQDRDSLQKVSADRIFLWMDNYCKANPLESVATGGFRLMFELRKK